MRCDWCTVQHQVGRADFYWLKLWGVEKHLICEDCYESLKRISNPWEMI